MNTSKISQQATLIITIITIIIIIINEAYARSVVLCVRNRAVVHPRQQLKPALTDFGQQPYSCT